MNIPYLMKYISRHLHTAVRRYTAEGAAAESCCARPTFKDLFRDEELFRAFRKLPASSAGDIPLIFSADGRFIYVMVRSAGGHILIGPVTFTAPIRFLHALDSRDIMGEDSAHPCMEQDTCRADRAYSRPDYRQWASSVSVCEFDSFTEDILLVCNLLSEKEITAKELLMANCAGIKNEMDIQRAFSRIVFENREYGRTHNPYDQELREFTAVEKGDIARLEESLAEDYTGEIGRLAEHPLRHAKNLAIVVITLASRAAMRGGVVPEAAYSLSDSYIQRVEKCRDVPSVFHLFHAAEYEYTNMVKEGNEKKEGLFDKEHNPHINKCKDYIFSHLHGKITVKEIADALGLNAAYLSELFHECEKMTLTDYIRAEKIKLARNLLTYSRYSYSEISSYLGFSSQSHLGKYFKAATGMTMGQYRSAYGVKAFESG